MSIFLLFITFVVFSIADLPSCFSADQQYQKCRSGLTCGSGHKVFEKNTTYPFWGSKKPKFCGQTPFELSCDGNQNLTLAIGDLTLRVVSANLENQTISVADDSLLDGGCPEIWNFTGENQFTLDSNTEKIDLFICSSNPGKASLSNFTCKRSQETSTTYHVFVSPDFGRNCTKIGDVPMLRSVKDHLHIRGSNLTLENALRKGFGLSYRLKDTSCRRCSNSGGICGSDSGSESFRCLCEDRPHMSSCDDGDGVNPTQGKNGKRRRVMVKILIGASAAVAGLIAASIFWYVYHRRKTKSYRTSSALLPRNISSDPSSKSFDVEKAEELLVGVHLFSYEELEEATNNFDPSKELGDGGFGTVYYGKLKDGRSVAVKRLYDNNFKRAEQFRNEVEILTGLRHPNLVALFGCSSKQSRDLLLVYEYVANGTLADHLHGPQANPSSLPWSIRLKIAVETASALKYLHASKIIHRDVKSNNILLDQNFNVKVADFGLSRLFPMDRTHVSTAPQGTPGYVDPDYHLCYQLSNKSDVYSFAVVLMELISSLPAVDITRPRNEINLSNMAVVKIQNHELRDMVDPSLGFDTDTRVRQTVIAVAELAFQCLQSDKDLRPCMSHVQDTLTRIQNNGFGSEMDVVDVNKSGPLVAQSPDSVIVKWDSK
ncbi:LEAF RUST 10 DISEASE-RESISTANCE LOCUS RECEPTOR-LIKE PROTEIN KINASE-like 1.2 isoform X1 [Arabidopsis lyrata subsp. lyrata]|uniref:LEAF RUST 10 DISEASE-RESISTANCE LOCUS RECEPTOR-LIKE PROTEIN KINASE-like 1.2 isoform X1 n=1 Tax=Arabidopsis lyrata subsp. lyrata TaxID=81972 RepID=UPI000A29B5DA|nr:LEAF RUST 10 DISEASE-RESISTANCE LOCUS RECEPTOR-LIKE PROTEIN KINASE-like 1.2 isoform X1 [Arabidopsis lyrata subsp. lyrata]|eukprot:XP_020867436.1 LEAF RUST 10 DISEASE-RESISTANCE LOCUS RECEPTOR-LIKE PROTEIN KINASE-like 1.2 isoform X1 [Arabidopsis lyrata subsp. lyrata]